MTLAVLYFYVHLLFAECLRRTNKDFCSKCEDVDPDIAKFNDTPGKFKLLQFNKNDVSDKLKCF